MLPFFKLILTDDPQTGTDFLSFVDNPAHMKDFVAFGEDQEAPKVKYFFNEEGEEQIVTGVMMSEGTPIYRNDKDLGEHYVIFDKETIKEAFYRFHKNQYGKNVNLDHDRAQQISEGVYMIDNYLVDEEQGVKAPKRLNQIVRNGSWIASYKIDNPEIWAKVKSNDFNGFSIEGYFDRVQVDVKKKFTKEVETGIIKKLEQMKKTLKDKVLAIFESETTEVVAEEVEVTLGEAVTDGGVELSYEGELAVGVLVTVMVDGQAVPAPEGAHSLTGELEGITIMLDGDGMVTDIVEAEADETEEVVEEEVTEEMAEVVEALASKMAAEVKDLKEENKILNEVNVELKETFTAQLKELTDKVAALEAQPITQPTKTKIKASIVKDTKNVNPVAFGYANK